MAKTEFASCAGPDLVGREGGVAFRVQLECGGRAGRVVIVVIGGYSAARDVTVDEQTFGAGIDDVVLEHDASGAVLDLELTAAGFLRVVIVQAVVHDGDVGASSGSDLL